MDSLNLSNFPLITLARGDAATSLYFEEVVGGITRSLTISTSEAVGLPEITDEEVLLGMIALTSHDSPTVTFTPGSMKDLLGWPRQGHYDKRLNQAVHRWNKVRLEFRGAWYDKVTGNYLDAYMNVLTTVIENRTKRGISSYEVTWNELVFQSLISGHTYKLDWTLYKKLSNPTSRRLFRVFSRHLHVGAFTQRYDARVLAFDKIGLSGRNLLDIAQIRQRISRGFVELEEIGFLLPSPEGRFHRRPDGGWDVVVQISPSPTPAQTKEWSSGEDKVFKALIEFGVHKTTARKLVETHGEEYVTGKIDVMRASKSEVREPAAFIVKACQGNWTKKQIDEPKEKSKVLPQVAQTDQPPEPSQWEKLSQNERLKIIEWALSEHGDLIEREIPAVVRKYPTVVEKMKEAAAEQLWKKYILDRE